MKGIDVFILFSILYVLIYFIVAIYKKHKDKKMHDLKCIYLESVGFKLNKRTNRNNPAYCKGDKFVSLAVIDRYTITELRNKYK